MPHTAIVIPASSTSGEACIVYLRERHPDVVVMAAYRTQEKADGAKAKFNDLNTIIGIDAGDKATLQKIFEGYDYAVLVTPHTGDFALDKIASENLALAALEQGVKHIVYVGSWTVSLKQARLIADRFQSTEDILAAQDKTTWTVLRGGYFMTNFLELKEFIKTSSTVSGPLLPFGYSMVDPRDIGKSAGAVVGSGKFENAVYEMSGPEKLTLQQIAEEFTKALGRPIAPVAVPLEILVTKLPKFLGELYEEVAEVGDVCIPHSTAVRDLTGQHTTFAEWLVDHKQVFL